MLPGFLSTADQVSQDFPDSGIRARTTTAGLRVVEIDYWAIPHRRKPGWRATMESKMGARAFRREFLRDWTTGKGDSYYPEFAEIGAEKYIYKLDTIPRSLILFRGFDFGIRHPVCIWGGYHPIQDRVFVFREFDPTGLGTHHFRDAVNYLSGDFDGELEDLPQQWVDDFIHKSGYPGPWFTRGLAWENISGAEATNTQANAARDPKDATAANIFAASGIWLTMQSGPVKARHEVLRRLLHLRPDGYPGILIDPSCEGVVKAISGLTYAKQTPSNPNPDRPRKDGLYDDRIDALTYAICGLVPAVDRPLPRLAAVGEFYKPREEPEPEVLGYYENKVGNAPKPQRGWDARVS